MSARSRSIRGAITYWATAHAPTMIVPRARFAFEVPANTITVAPTAIPEKKITGSTRPTRAPASVRVGRTAKAAGASVPRPARDTDWGGRSGYFADPDGHLWEIAWNPFWPVDDAGRMQIPTPAA